MAVFEGVSDYLGGRPAGTRRNRIDACLQFGRNFQRIGHKRRCHGSGNPINARVRSVFFPKVCFDKGGVRMLLDVPRNESEGSRSEIMSPSEIDDAFAQAMIGLNDGDWGSGDPGGINPTGWAAVARLQNAATREVLDAALAACSAPDPVRRQVGAAVLGQLGHSKPGLEPVFCEERFTGLMVLLNAEREESGHPQVLAAACFALGHLHDRRAISTLLDLVPHPDTDVRYGVTSALSAHDDAAAIGGLIALSADANDEIRDWATFGLGQLVETDTPQIRAALRARLDDPCVDARNEAIEGLATRNDQSVLPVLIRELYRQVAVPLLDACIAMATPELCDALAAAADVGLVWEADGRRHDLWEHWAEARRTCGCESKSTDTVRSA